MVTAIELADETGKATITPEFIATFDSNAADEPKATGFKSCPALFAGVSQTMVLVPVRYPLSKAGVQTITRAVELADGFDDAALYVFYANLLQKSERVTPNDLKTAIEQEVGPLANASYNVANAFLLEEAILNEAAQEDADYVVIGHSLRGRLRNLVADRLDLGVDLEGFLRERLDAELIVV